MPTADIILATVVREHDAQRKRMETIDHKASTLLGFMITAAGIFGGLLLSGQSELPHLALWPTILLSLASLALGVAAVCFAVCLLPRKFAVPDTQHVTRPSELEETEASVAFAHAEAYASSIEFNEERPIAGKMKCFMCGLWAFVIAVACTCLLAVVLMNS